MAEAGAANARDTNCGSGGQLKHLASIHAFFSLFRCAIVQGMGEDRCL